MKEGSIPLSSSIELGIEFLGIKVSRVRFLITQNSSEVLDLKHNTKQSGILNQKLVKLVYQEFIKKHSDTMFENVSVPGQGRSSYFHSSVSFTVLMCYQL